jgi:hypothetical protein
MRYEVIRTTTIETPHGEIILPVGKILKLTAEQAELLSGNVKQIATADDYPSTQPPSLQLTVQDKCPAIKVGGRVCGAPLKKGLNGFSSCSDMACQVPATPHGLVPPGGLSVYHRQPLSFSYGLTA